MSYIEEAVKRYPYLEECEKDMEALTEAICRMYREGGKVLLCGNGGSAADCEHISGELLKGFLLTRTPEKNEIPLEDNILSGLQKGIPAIPLSSFSSAMTAFSNDEDGALSFAQLVFALGKKEDVFIGISTSGNSENIVAAAKTAKALGMKATALTGGKKSQLSEICDITVRVPERETFKVQELHLPVYHSICAECERRIFGK